MVHIYITWPKLFSFWIIQALFNLIDVPAEFQGIFNLLISIKPCFNHDY